MQVNQINLLYRSLRKLCFIRPMYVQGMQMDVSSKQTELKYFVYNFVHIHQTQCIFMSILRLFPELKIFLTGLHVYLVHSSKEA